MRKLVVFFIAALVAVVLAGCGGSNEKLPTTHFAHDWYIVYVPYQGGTVRCLEHHAKNGQYAWGGPTCDFVAFYKARKGVTP